MQFPHFEIQFRTNPRETVIKCNGEDISKSVRRVSITQDPHGIPEVTLELIQCDISADADVVLRLTDIATKSQNPPPDGSQWP